MRCLSPESLVVRLYSGLDDRERIQAALPGHSEGAVVAGVTNEGVLQPEPVLGIQAGRGKTVRRLATGTGHGSASPLTMLLSRASFPTTVLADIVWGKLAVSATTDGLFGLRDVRKGSVADHPTLPRVASVVTDEVIAGRSISIADLAETAFTGAPATRRHRSSMLHNLASGGRTNADAIRGVIVERARAVGRKAGLCATLAAPIRARNGARAETGEMVDDRGEGRTAEA